MEIISTMPFTFYGETFECYYCDGRRFYLPLNRVCEAIGVDSTVQRQRIQRDEAISEDLIVFDVQAMAEDGNLRTSKTDSLWLERLPYWLGTIEASRFRPEIKDRLILFKKEFAEAAWAVFRTDLVPQDILAETDTYLSPEQRQWHELHDQARMLQKQLTEITDRISKYESRLGVLEDRDAPDWPAFIDCY